MSDWRPISTAPKSGRIIGWAGEVVTLDYQPPVDWGINKHIHSDEAWVQISDSGRATQFFPTLWMPCPEPPVKSGT